MRTLITGSNGFIGKELCLYLSREGHYVRGGVRRKEENIRGACTDFVVTGDIGPATDWSLVLEGIDSIVHLAGRVHVTRDTSKEPMAEFRKVNVSGTEGLARQAAKAGVKRFIFVSSVKVNGEGRPEPYREDDSSKPQDAYGISKLEAEQVLARVSADTGMSVVILRLPLVYGQGVKANFRSLFKLSASGLPLPFKAIDNRRSFLYLGNLVDAIDLCLNHPRAAGETFMVSDGQDVSTPDLIRTIASAMNKRVRLFSVSKAILRGVCGFLGKREGIEKLIGSLIVDSSKIRNTLGWHPPFTLEDGICETARYYINND